jgi:Protein of unknown function (DUF2946)
MRPDRPRLGAIAAWLGMIALGLNALVPVHLAFDLAHGLGPGEHHEGMCAGGRYLEWPWLALLSGHLHAAGKSDRHGKHHHGAACPVCGSLGTLAGFAPTAGAALPVPVPIAAAIPVAATAGEPDSAPLAGYRARAPPLA